MMKSWHIFSISNPTICGSPFRMLQKINTQNYTGETIKLNGLYSLSNKTRATKSSNTRVLSQHVVA